MKSLSILIPVKNCDKFFDLTLKNILISESGIEVLVADGGSTDSTFDILELYRSKGLSIRVVSESDQGQSNALNILLRHVRTDFFIWLNADDVIVPEFIQYALDTINSSSKEDLHSLVSITSNSIIVDTNNNFMAYQYCFSDSKYLIKNGLWFGKFPCRVWNTRIARQCGGLNEDLHYCMDFDFLRRQYIGVKYPRTIHCNKFLGAFRHHPESKTGNSNNTPLVRSEMASILTQSVLKRYFFKLLSLLLRTTNPRYMFYRFLGKLAIFNSEGKRLERKIRFYD
jgi:glycosyltransferase involved in cell wall biosynthesis